MLVCKDAADVSHVCYSTCLYCEKSALSSGCCIHHCFNTIKLSNTLCMLTIKSTMQGVLASANFPLDLLPMLEVVQTITEPLLAKLRFHFASGRPTDRIDQPDWLFETAAMATAEHLESFKALQPAVQSHGLGKVFYLPFEYARAMHAAVQTILREHVLSRLSRQVRPLCTRAKLQRHLV